MVKDAERFADEDKARKEAAEAKNNAESLIHTTERQIVEHGDKVSAEVKTEIETALAEAKTAVESGDAEAMKDKASALATAAMKLGQAIYEQEQATAQQTGGGDAPDAAPADDDVVDAEFSEVDDKS
jgi:molecular chaperone DnaK